MGEGGRIESCGGFIGHETSRMGTCLTGMGYLTQHGAYLRQRMGDQTLAGRAEDAPEAQPRTFGKIKEDVHVTDFKAWRYSMAGRFG